MDAGGPAALAPSDRTLLVAFAATPFLWLGLRTLTRRRRVDPDAPLEKRRRRARKALARALRDEDDPAGHLLAFTTFLAARTREPDEAWTGRDPEEWSAARANGARERNGSQPAQEWRSAAELMARLEAGVYGDGGPVGSDEVLEVADGLVRSGL